MVMVTESIALQPVPFETVRYNLVVVLMVAMGFCKLLLLSTATGNQEYEPAVPLPFNVTVFDPLTQKAVSVPASARMVPAVFIVLMMLSLQPLISVTINFTS